jgi:signal transduction histidine kinase
VNNSNRNALKRIDNPVNQSNTKVPRELLVFYLIISGIILAAGIIFFFAQKNQITETRSAELSSVAEMKVNQIQSFRKERFAEGNYLFGNKTFIEAVKIFLTDTSFENKSRVNDWLATLLTNHNYVEINIIEPSTARIFYAVSKRKQNLIEAVPEAMDCFKSGKITFSDFHLSPVDSTIHLEIFVPLMLRRANGYENVAVVQFVIDPKRDLYGMIQSWPAKSKSGEVLLIKREGDDVVFLNELRFRENTALKFRLPINNNDLPAAWAAQGIETVGEGIDYRQVPVLAATRSIPGTNWHLIVKIDTKEVYSGLLFRGAVIFVLIVLMLLALALGLVAFWRNREAHHYKSRAADLETINRLSRVYKLLSRVGFNSFKAENKEKLLTDACRIIFDDGGYDLCWLGVIPPRSGKIQTLAQFSSDASYLETAISAVSQPFSADTNPLNKVISSGQYFVSNDIRNDPALTERESSVHKALKSLAAFPISQDGKVMGIIKVYSKHKNFFSEDELDLLSRLSLELSFALEKIDAEDMERIIKKELVESDVKIREKNEELENLNEKLLLLNAELVKSNESIRKINEDLSVAREKAEESDRLKSAFLANMSHEIRTPMNAIIGFAGLLGSSDLTADEREKYSKIVVDRSDDLLQIISDILDISKIESRTLILFKETYLLDTMLDELLLIYTKKLMLYENNKLKLLCKKPPYNQPLAITTDKLKFRQIFTNLIDNAIKFTESGEISFGFHSMDKNSLTCFVSDTGTGIEEKSTKFIFEIFRQANSPRQKIARGTGLGLAICKGNAQLLGGDIWVQSKPGVGSTFFFKVGIGHPPVEMAGQKVEESMKVQWNIKNILIIEDDAHSIDYLRTILQNSQAVLHVAHDGKEARALYHKLQDFDLVLLDLKLPDTNGLNLVKEMKSLRKNLPVIAQTAFAMEMDRKQSLEAGCDDYISKPYKREELIALINIYL